MNDIQFVCGIDYLNYKRPLPVVDYYLKSTIFSREGYQNDKNCPSIRRVQIHFQNCPQSTYYRVQTGKCLYCSTGYFTRKINDIACIKCQKGFNC